MAVIHTLPVQRLSQAPSLAALLAGADHVDVKSVTSANDLRTFLAKMFAYQPGWISALYHVRSGFVRLLGMRQKGIPQRPGFTAETIPMRVGASAGFFRVVLAEENRVWAAEASETHLQAHLVVLADAPHEDGMRRYRVVTVVNYRKWTGPVYFNVIRPFHHLVVGAMARAGAR